MDRQFPPEVVVLIVEASLDPYDSFDMLDDHIPRYSTLCSYSRLNSVWRSISKPLLYESVVITTEEAGEALLEVLKGGGDEMGMVRSLRVFNDEQRGTMERLVGRLYAQVESLALDGVYIGHLAIANRLHRLLLREDSFLPLFTPADPRGLSHLQHLELEDRYTDYDLTPQSLPSLRSLSLVDSENIVIEPALLNTLTALHLDDEDTCRRFFPTPRISFFSPFPTTLTAKPPSPLSPQLPDLFDLDGIRLRVPYTRCAIKLTTRNLDSRRFSGTNVGDRGPETIAKQRP